MNVRHLRYLKAFARSAENITLLYGLKTCSGAPKHGQNRHRGVKKDRALRQALRRQNCQNRHWGPKTGVEGAKIGDRGTKTCTGVPNKALRAPTQV